MKVGDVWEISEEEKEASYMMFGQSKSKDLK